MGIALRTAPDTHPWRAPDNPIAFGLRDTAGHRDAHVAAITRGFVLDAAQPPELRVNLFGGLFSDVTCIEDHQISVVYACGFDKAFRCQRVHHALRIVDIHLTAI